jgi:hypothetical protein
MKIALVFLLSVSCLIAFAQEEPMGDTDSDNVQDGSLNTNTVGSVVSSNNNSKDDSVSNTFNGAGSSSSMPVGSAIAPSYMSNGMETCLSGSGTSIQTGLVGYTKGSYQKDVDCNRRRDAKVLSDLGMKVAAIARMCEDHKVWRSLFMSATPCPLLSGGRLIVGRRAFQMMKMNPQLHIPDYGEVRMRASATWSKKPPTPRYNDTQKWYNSILQIGADENEEQVQDGDDSESVSDKFRSSIK